MNKYISNSFSLNMLDDISFTLCRVRKIQPEDIPQEGLESVIGHQDTAAVVSSILGFPVPANRKGIILEAGDILYVAQLVGHRLPEGATQLPEGCEIKFYEIQHGQGCRDCSGIDCNLCGMQYWLRGV